MNDERSNDILSFDSEISIERAKDTKKTLKRLIKLLLNQKWKLIVVIFFAIMSLAFTMSSPLIFSEAINTIYDGIKNAPSSSYFNIRFDIIMKLAFMLLGIYLLSFISNYIQQYIMASVSQTLVFSIRKNLSEKLTKVPLKYYDTHKKGEILSRISNDLEKVSDTLQSGLMQFITAILSIIAAVTFMILINWILALVAIFSIIMGIIVTSMFEKKSINYFTNRQESLGRFNGEIEEYFTGQIEVKAFNMEEDIIKAVEISNEKLYLDEKRAQFITYAINPLIRLMNQVGYVVIAAIGAIFAIQGRLSIGIIQAFFQYVDQASEPLTEAAYILNSMQAAIASAERVFEILDEVEEEGDIVNNKTISNSKGDIEFKNIKFGYEKEVLISGVNLKVTAGQKVAIVGPTGAGKTTLINLLIRFYDLNSGKIEIDGIDITKLKRSDLRGLFGMVLQDAWLFDGSIKDNISYGKESADISEIKEAAKLAKIDDFIRALPHGYDTVLSDENSSISQGQKQLLCIARAILAEPKVLILDEATSSVDTRTELEIQSAMDNLMKGRTSFIIAHRLSTIKNADKILVMDKGDIVEQGTHKELLVQGGLYSNIYNSQFSYRN
ncbi:putative ABC transporter ATP-binding protein [Clostridium saccharobutylicum]|uniref:ABC transporter ATP-binding protein n=1 Tax=Clostridium saccharobutylicum TaxID=169679 RepID=UPI000983A399|nr:ABC transporter ATP-binding protein [Clostridium saccharobutylicum]AQS08857.1 putative ABC transporter ATP-binding protein [Clostridium saccharobutylicum]MBC2437780.1 ABC transporter ATP-binding protein [Clostridium saccharobutylicum]NSB90205.1 ATP-binding cassette subfamily B protein [Clostridium saccharobutylicum]NYC28795.1 ATP-binding cassette subfamily B protein [Clostridium saccharobutylicum]OOM14738.1 putative ABC transporter ATP-binding protein [Clostridium saccharobutylicum]